MSSPPLPDLDALSADGLKRLVVQLLARVAALEEEDRRLREENARLKKLPKRPRLAPGGMDRATGPRRRRRTGRGGGRTPPATEERVLTVGGAAGLAAQGLRALHRPGPGALVAGGPLPAGAVGDAGRARARRPAAAGGGGPLRPRRGALRPDAARPGAGHRRAPAGPAAGLGRPHRQGPARRPADRAPGRLPRRDGRDPGGRAGDRRHLTFSR